VPAAYNGAYEDPIEMGALALAKSKIAALGRDGELRQSDQTSIDPRAPDFLLSHPATPERVKNAQATARQFGAPVASERDRIVSRHHRRRRARNPNSAAFTPASCLRRHCGTAMPLSSVKWNS
jgi:hypothetical protein